MEHAGVTARAGQLQTPRTREFTTYEPPLDRSKYNNTTMHKTGNLSSRSAAPTAVQIPRSEIDIFDNDGPTPRANVLVVDSSPLFRPTSPYVSSPSLCSREGTSPSNRSSISGFDSLYDVSSSSDDEHIDAFFLQLQASDSVKNSASKRKEKPALVIPEADQWPTIQKLRKKLGSGEVSPATRQPLSPAALARLANSSLNPPTNEGTPSLVESSSTTDERSISCPSTPDPRLSVIEDENFEMPMQLNPLAMDTLQNISPDFNQYEIDQALAASAADGQEMQDLGYNLAVVTCPSEENTLTTPLSVLSVPSPGGFFASLNEASRKSWFPSASHIETPTSAVAEMYYLGTENAWPERELKQVVHARNNSQSDGPPTARQEDCRRKSSMDSVSVDEMSLKDGVYEYDENYTTKLLDNASSNMNRTSLWLSAQETYLNGLVSPERQCHRKQLARLRTSDTEEEGSALTSSPETKAASPMKRVRFSRHMTGARAAPRNLPSSPKNDSLFYHAFQHLYDGAGKRDAVRYGQTRSEALQLQRLYIPKDHLSQLVGNREIKSELTTPEKNVSGLPERPDDAIAEARKAAVALANIERQALDQIKTSVWNLEATRQLNGGSLLDKHTVNLLKSRARKGQETLILDVGGEPTADWGWAVAIEHRNANVYTVVPSTPTSPTNWQAHRGPTNHRTIGVTDPWTLPFPSDTFDLVSARTLHTLLHSKKPTKSPPRPSAPFAHDFPQSSPLSTSDQTLKSPSSDDDDDEFDATLKELNRVLKPGGILSFSLMDAELFYPSPFSTSIKDKATSPVSSLAALSINFSEALKRHNYDPVATMNFLPRLKHAGFGGVRRAWTVLPLTCHSFSGTKLSSAPDVGADIGRAIGSVNDGVRGGTGEVAGLTGLVGGLAWEKWMVGLAAEMGREGEKVVARCGRVYAECRRAGSEIEQGKGAGWRCLRGWCQKPWTTAEGGSVGFNGGGGRA